jgi:hypothetical protein
VCGKNVNNPAMPSLEHIKKEREKEKEKLDKDT